MALVVNHNMMAANTARTLNSNYNKLNTSVQRLSSGLRINSAADDAAGLAIRELMRSDISTLNQGVRNANDAISLIQTADGALSVIDEKLIRMKELAEQAATGTYTSTQRLIIDSEYQQMASEITRIANATDFNGIHLLDGTIASDTHDGKGVSATDLSSTGKLKIHFGTGNDEKEDYYYIQIGCCTASAFGLGNQSTPKAAPPASPKKAADLSPTEKATIQRFLALGDVVADGWENNANIKRFMALYDDGTGNSVALTGSPTVNNSHPDVVIINSAATDAGFNPSANVPDLSALQKTAGDWKTMHGVGTTYSLLQTAMSGVAGDDDGLAGHDISTQANAQRALVAIDEAIVSKDNIRAHIGALQNRFENTISNLEIQAENLQAAESRISDVDVATEMTQFIRNQILTQTGVAMLSQANSLPQMALQLLQ